MTELVLPARSVTLIVLVEVEHVVHGQRCLTCQLRTIVVLHWARVCASVFLLGSPVLIYLLHVLSSHQHPLKLFRVCIEYIVFFQVPFKSTLGSLSLFDEVCLVAKGNKQETERVVVILTLVLLAGIVYPVVGKNGFGVFPVDGIPVPVYTTFLVLGNEMIEAYFLHVVWPFGIDEILLENICGI